MNLLNRILLRYFSRHSLPFWYILLSDCLIIFVSGFFSYWVYSRLAGIDFDFIPLANELILYVLISFVGIRMFHTYAGVLRYSSFVDLQRVAFANLVSMVLVIIAHYPILHYVPKDIFIHLYTWHIIVMYVLATLLMWGMRTSVKQVFDIATSDKRAKRVLIYGAMSDGVGLAKDIRSQKPTRFVLKGFISPDGSLTHKRLMGERVFGVNESLLSDITNLGVEAVLISPSKKAEFSKASDLQDELLGAGIKLYVVQTVKEWNDEEGNAGVQLKEVAVEDLLPRDEIHIDMKLIEEQLKGHRILITGSAGSIGSEIARQVASFNPSKMMLVDQAETPQHDIRLMMRNDFPAVDAETVVTSICREDRMEKIFSEFRPEYVFHAAAYKHVPMMEDNPSEAVLNNVLGTKIIADLSVKYGVRKFVMISTDKAVNPTNVMGCSKRICEIYVQSLNHTQNSCQFVTTRFGNVLGSNGSVIPLFREQIKNGGPVTVTDERIVRFFMLIPEACKLVLEAGTKGHGGEIFVFDMGKPVKIIDLAKRMIALSNAKNVEIKITGLREGEKLYEEVLNELEGTKASFHEKIRIADVRQYDYHDVCQEIDELVAISRNYDDMATVAKMKSIVPEYKSNNSKYEQLDKKH